MDLDLLGADDGPAALRLRCTHPGVSGRVAMAHAVAMRHLEETVARGDGADRHRLEEDVEARVASAQRKRLRAMTRRMMSLVPSQISSSRASRNHFCTGE